MTAYEISNPSDRVTIAGDDLAVVRAATILLGEGAYGLTNAAGEQVLPIFLFGGYDAWAAAEAFDLNAILAGRKAEVADVLASVALGDFADRKDVDNARALMDPAAFKEWMARRNDARRSSLNNIEGRAHALADSLRPARPTGGEA